MLQLAFPPAKHHDLQRISACIFSFQTLRRTSTQCRLTARGHLQHQNNEDRVMSGSSLCLQLEECMYLVVPWGCATQVAPTYQLPSSEVKTLIKRERERGRKGHIQAYTYTNRERESGKEREGERCANTCGRTSFEDPAQPKLAVLHTASGFLLFVRPLHASPTARCQKPKTAVFFSQAH